MDPKNLVVRESRDSEHHPNSTPVIVAFDVTGSMGDVPERFAKELLGSLMRLLVENGYATDPQMLFAAVGDAVSDTAPFQVGQFESGLEMDMWLTKLWLEGSGGDAPESYLLPHWFVAHHTKTDSWEKRKKKGYLFTIGDAPNKSLDKEQIERVFGYKPEQATDDESVVAVASEKWEVFHIFLDRGNSADREIVVWQKLLGDRVLALDEVSAICDLIGITIGVVEGNLQLDSVTAKGFPRAIETLERIL
jgi:hypothetical protein